MCQRLHDNVLYDFYLQEHVNHKTCLLEDKILRMIAKSTFQYTLFYEYTWLFQVIQNVYLILNSTA